MKTEQFKSGITIASNSFWFLWQHLKLITYYAIPGTLSALVEIVRYNIILHTTDQTDLALGIQTVFAFWSSTLSFAGIFGTLLINLVEITLLTLCNVALIYHVISIIKQQPASIKKSLSIIAKKWPIILSWSLITTIIILGTNIAAGPSLLPKEMNLSQASLLVSTTAWSLITFFITTLIATEKISLAHAFTRSMRLVQAHFMQIIGGLFWLALIVLLLVIPYFATRILLLAHPTLTSPVITVIINTAISYLLLIGQYAIATVFAIFKAKLYLKKRKS